MSQKGSKRKGRGGEYQDNLGKGVETQSLVERYDGQHYNQIQEEEIVQMKKQLAVITKKVQHFHSLREMCEDSKSKLEYKIHLDYDFQEELPYFYGSLDSDKLVEWMDTFERVFHDSQIPETRKVKLASNHLKGWVFEWWKQIQVSRQRSGKEKVRNWGKMKKKLKKKFLKDHECNFVERQQNRSSTRSGQQLLSCFGSLTRSGQPLKSTSRAGQVHFSSPKVGISSPFGRRSDCGVGQLLQIEKALVPAPKQLQSFCFGGGEQPQSNEFVNFKCVEMEEHYDLPIYDEYLSESEELYATNEDYFEKLHPMYDQPSCEEPSNEFEQWLREYMLLPKKEKEVSKPPTNYPLNSMSLMEESVDSGGICTSIALENEAAFEIPSADFVPITSLLASKSFIQESQQNGFIFALSPGKTVAGNTYFDGVGDLLQPYMDEVVEFKPIYDEPHEVQPLYDLFLSVAQVENCKGSKGHLEAAIGGMWIDGGLIQVSFVLGGTIVQIDRGAAKWIKIFKRHNKLFDWLILNATIT